MSREIKFRGYSKELQKWFYGSLYNGLSWSDFIISNEGFESRQQVVHESVGQYTGLEDKNGNPIYEGDIITFPELYETPEMTSTKYIQSSVIFYEGAFYLSFPDKDYHYTGESNLAQEMFAYDGNFEIVGSIYETPSLINPEK